MYTCLAVLLSVIREYPIDSLCNTTSLHQTNSCLLFLSNPVILCVILLVYIKL